MTRFKDKYRIGSARRPGWDYTTAAWYFVTICTAHRQPFLGEVIDSAMQLSPIGQTANTCFLAIPNHTQTVCLIDTHQVMPNHIHGIIAIVETLHRNVSTAPPGNVPTITNPQMSAISPKIGSLSALIRSFKSAVTYWCRNNGYPDFGWQTRFHDRIIRNERELNAIRAYIQNNPANWPQDRDNPPGLHM